MLPPAASPPRHPRSMQLHQGEPLHLAATLPAVPCRHPACCTTSKLHAAHCPSHSFQPVAVFGRPARAGSSHPASAIPSLPHAQFHFMPSSSLPVNSFWWGGMGACMAATCPGPAPLSWSRRSAACWLREGALAAAAVRRVSALQAVGLRLLCMWVGEHWALLAGTLLSLPERSIVAAGAGCSSEPLWSRWPFPTSLACRHLATLRFWLHRAPAGARRHGWSAG